MFLHQQLRAAREQADLTQSELAKLAGIPRNQIVRAEKGENITIDTLRKIAAHLPITSLTLLENVQLTADVLPQPQKIYLGAMATLWHMNEALGSAVGLAMAARAAMDAAHAREPLVAETNIGAIPNQEEDLLLFKSIERSYHQIERQILETVQRDAEAQARKAAGSS